MQSPVDGLAAHPDLLDRIGSRLLAARDSRHGGARPFVTLSYAQSVDGCIAARRGQSLRLSGEESRRLTHQLRACHDAILIGVNTALIDDPQLTVRLIEGPDPLPVVVDTKLRIDPAARLFANRRPPVIIAGWSASERKAERLRSLGASVHRVIETDSRLVDLGAALRKLSTLGIRSVMIEGGARVITNVLRHGLADQLVLTIAPQFVRGLRAARRRRDGQADELSGLANVDCGVYGSDMVIRADFERRASPVRPDGSVGSLNGRRVQFFPAGVIDGDEAAGALRPGRNS